MLDPQVRDVLVGMKEHLSKGWVQEELVSDKGVCLFGAMALAADLKPRILPGGGSIRGRQGSGFGYAYRPDSPESKTMETISKHIGIPVEDLALWNDAKGRTVDEIVAVLDQILLSDSAMPEISAEEEDQRSSTPTREMVRST